MALRTVAPHFEEKAEHLHLWEDRYMLSGANCGLGALCSSVWGQRLWKLSAKATDCASVSFPICKFQSV